jgi:hypothetical protein
MKTYEIRFTKLTEHEIYIAFCEIEKYYNAYIAKTDLALSKNSLANNCILHFWEHNTKFYSFALLDYRVNKLKRNKLYKH